MITTKTKDEIKKLAEGGRRLSRVLTEVAAAAKPGVTTLELDQLAERLIRAGGDEPSFLRYQPWGAAYPYPASLCVSVNNEVVHGIPGTYRLKEGDIVSLDLGLTHEGLITDSAVTVGVGAIDTKSQALLEATKQALEAGIASVKIGGFVGDIGRAIEKASKGYGIVEELGGHGVGHEVHEEPYIPNFSMKGNGPKLKEGMVLALEPMLTLGKKEVYLDKDGYTWKTADSNRAAHFEHTIAITKDGVKILTA